MRTIKRERLISILIAVSLNIALVCGVIYSVVSAFNNAESVSFSQNIENVRTLTNASANKIELEFKYNTEVIETLAQYINQYNDVGMTQSELDDYFVACYGEQDAYSWQIVDNTLSGSSPSSQGFNAYLPCTGEKGFMYRVNAYPELAKQFCKASKETLNNKSSYTNEFTDASKELKKSSALTTTVRIRNGSSYEYKTLMLLIRSSYINELISSNNQIDTLSFFGYSNIIIDNDGNYVISNSQFQGTNFMDYMELYNDNFTKTDASELSKELRQDNYENVMFYNDSRGRECAYTIVPVHNSDWHVLSMVPVSSFKNSYDFTSNFTRFAAFFALLFALDIVVMFYINHQLRQMSKKAEEASKSKSRFLSSMSHDIRTPMNAIVGMTIIADKQLDEETINRDAVRDSIKSIEQSSNHLLTLINDILDVSKIESGKITLHPKEFSIAESLSEAIELNMTKINEKDFVFDTQIHNVKHEYITGDSLRIEQIFINILTNAVKYTEPGGKITVELTEESSDKGAEFSRYTYSVADTGIGMTPEYVAVIFDSFSRAVDTRINTIQGTGLGMAIVKQLVDMMGGSITVQSELNVGSTFTVVLDLPIIPNNSDEKQYENLSALIIDDNNSRRDSVAVMLRDAGASVDTEQDGTRGIERATLRLRDNNPYNFIFVKWQLSGNSGGETVSALRSNLGNDVHIIIMTDYQVLEIEQTARQCGANGFLMQPLFRSKLFGAVDAGLQKSDVQNGKSEETFPDMRVLVAEDNDTNWKIINKILKFYGINALRAKNGKIALDMVCDAEQLPELVLMDIQMPIMNGYEATKAIRNLDDKNKADIPIFAMSADAFDDDVRRCQDVGMNGHLSKPINLQKLQEVLRENYHH